MASLKRYVLLHRLSGELQKGRGVWFPPSDNLAPYALPILLVSLPNDENRGTQFDNELQSREQASDQTTLFDAI